MPIHIHINGNTCDKIEHLIGNIDFLQKSFGLNDGVAQFTVLLLPALLKISRALLVGCPSLDHFNPLVKIRYPFNLDAESKTIKELRPQLSLFGIHGADQDKPGGMGI